MGAERRVKVVFLDFDGVLNSLEFFQRAPGGLDRLDPAAVARLNRLLAASQAKVVVSSSWRVGRTKAELRDLLEKVGFQGSIVGCTPDLSSVIRFSDYEVVRAREVRTWLESSIVPVTQFVILDDARLEDDEIAEHLVRTSFELGLQDSHVGEALAILKRARPLPPSR